jgi:hypothetical protein
MLFRNCLLKCVIERKIERRIEVLGTCGWKHSNYWMTVRESKDIGNLRRKQQIAFPRELAMEGALGLS